MEIIYIKVAMYLKTLYKCWLLPQVAFSVLLTNILTCDCMTEVQPKDGGTFNTYPPTPPTFSW